MGQRQQLASEPDEAASDEDTLAYLNCQGPAGQSGGGHIRVCQRQGRLGLVDDIIGHSFEAC